MQSQEELTPKSAGGDRYAKVTGAAMPHTHIPTRSPSPTHRHKHRHNKHRSWEKKDDGEYVKDDGVGHGKKLKFKKKTRSEIESRSTRKMKTVAMFLALKEWNQRKIPSLKFKTWEILTPNKFQIRRQCISAISILMERSLLSQEFMRDGVLPGLFFIYQAGVGTFQSNDLRMECVQVGSLSFFV